MQAIARLSPQIHGNAPYQATHRQQAKRGAGMGTKEGGSNFETGQTARSKAA